MAAHETGWLPEGELFAQLRADPREPHFAVHYQARDIPNAYFNSALTAVGDYFPFVRSDSGIGRFELGITGGIFSLFNLDGDTQLELVHVAFIRYISLLVAWAGIVRDATGLP